ncbi:unnamed protein product [Trichobilharzia regenti]|nr:unnamed protein product [Trichobilharzia regenti]
MGCCYTTSNRRLPNGNIHCELDVESADSGRGASEDDPSQLGGQFIHFYPACNVSSVPQQSLAQVVDSSSVNMNGGTSSNCIQSHKLQNDSSNDASGVVILTVCCFKCRNNQIYHPVTTGVLYLWENAATQNEYD